MKKQKSNISKIVLIILGIIILAVAGKYIFFRNNITYNNLKLIPKDCNNYLIINTSSIKKQITSYFFNYPANLLSLNKNTKNFKTEFGDIDFNLYEPISIFWDENTNITVANFSINGSEKLNPLKFDLLNIENTNRDIYINEKKNTIYFRDVSINRVSVFFSDEEINPKVIIEDFLSKISVTDTASYNKSALTSFKNNTHSVIFNIENEFLKNIGLIENFGEVDLSTDKISFKIKGTTNDHFIFKDSDTLKIINDCWGNVSGNFNLKNFNSSLINNLNLDNQWNGIFSIGLKEIKNITSLMNLNKAEQLPEFFNFDLFIGSVKPFKSDTLTTQYGILKGDSNSNGYLLNNLNPLKLTNGKKEYFKVSINFEEMLNQKTNDFSWNSIKLIMKKFNLENIDLGCFKRNKNEFVIEGQLNSVDSTRHILLSPFI